MDMMYAQSANGHSIVLMAAHTGPVQPELTYFRKPRSRGGSAMTRYRHERPRFDGRNQMVYEITTDGGRCVRRTFGATNGNASYPHRKGRPRGSKNKRSVVSNAFNYRCEKKSFAYESTTSIKCKACSQTFDGDPAVHCLEHHETMCSVCGGSYQPQLMAAHIRSHGIRPSSLTVTCHECYECKEKYGNAEIMAAHVGDQHVRDSGAQECVLCGCKFDCRQAFVEHIVTTHCPRKTFRHPTVYRCRVCQAGFKSQINVLRHACNQIKSPHCARCDKTFPSKMRYSFHMQFHEHPGCAPMHLHCDICLAEFEDEYQLYDHIRFRHELHDKAVCEICGRTFKSSMGLNIHRRYHNGSRNFTCKSCDKSFLNKSTLKEHEISHMDVKPFQCHICGQYLSRASRLRSHVKTHKAAESTAQLCYCCGRCGFVAPNRVLLAEHLNKEHDGDQSTGDLVDGLHRAQEEEDKEVEEKENRGFGGSETNVIELRSVVKCEFCDSTYMDAVSLNSHRDAAHSSCDDSEAFICVVCSSTFSTYSRLTTHKLTHGINMESSLANSEPSTTADKDRFDVPQYFSCQYCAKRCLHYTYFCLHRRLKHPPLGVQTHTCDRCFLDFKTSWRLSYHKKTVHGQPAAGRSSERYECTVCSRKFVKIGALNLHKTRTHIDVNSGVCKYLCHECGKFFSSECTLRNHGKTHDDATGRLRDDQLANQLRRKYRKSVATATVKSPVKNSCPYCDETIEDKADFIKHVNHHIQCKPPTQVSHTCGDDSLADSATVLGGGDDDDGAPRSADSSMLCDLCDQRLANAALLNSHLAEHAASDNVFLCTACYTPFLSFAVYDVHRVTCGKRRGPDVQFVGLSERTLDDDGPRPALVIECSKMFNGKLSQQMATGHDGATSEIDHTLDTSLLDEFLSITSTTLPPASDHVHIHPANDDLQDIFDILQTGR